MRGILMRDCLSRENVQEYRMVIENTGSHNISRIKAKSGTIGRDKGAFPTMRLSQRRVSRSIFTFDFLEYLSQALFGIFQMVIFDRMEKSFDCIRYLH